MDEKAPIKVYECGKNKKVKNKHFLAPQWPFRLLICKKSGCSKTNFLLNFIYDNLYFQKIYLYAKDLEEDKFEDLMTNLNVLRKN